jgi:hypothetical protein
MLKIENNLPDVIIISLDMSGSMHGSRWNNSVEGIK